MRRHLSPPSKSSRRGVITLEFIVWAPVVFIAMVAIVQFWMLGLVQQAATSALIEGTREGAEAFPGAVAFDTAGADNDIKDQIFATMNEFLNVHNLEVLEDGAADDPNKANVTVMIERGLTPAFTRGGGTCNRTGAGPAANEIVVTLCFPIVDATDPDGLGNPVPDWLAPVGFSLSAYRFEMTSRATLE